ncbi:hypothetical protein E6H23_08055 [Candidatus Bathyarchaeota archaeon]|nr:MAG: hypothetical protein E6H23_08055 [Candidatus Bathyarchaeota archaeon]
MEKEIIVGVQSGNVTFSFKTDQDGSNLKEGFDTINRLISSHRDLLQKASLTFPLTTPIIRQQSTVSLAQLGIPANEKEAILGTI